MTVNVGRRSRSALSFGGSAFGAMRPSTVPRLDPTSHFQRSLQGSTSVSAKELRNLGETVLVQKAISRIVNGILAMPWQVLPPKEDMKKESAIARADELRQALLHPVREGEHNTYAKLIHAIVAELITIGVAAVERHPGAPGTQPFWLYLADSTRIRLNQDWTPEQSGIIPRYYEAVDHDYWTPFLSRDMFLIQQKATTHQLVPPSPVAIAHQLISAWLGVSQYQNDTVSRGVRSYMLNIEDEEIDDEQLLAFREYWRRDVEGKGEIPILAGKVKKTDLNSRTDDELYPKYTEYRLRLIALAFNLSARDYNIVEPDNRGTAEIAADQTFAQAVLPMAMCIGDHMNLEVIDYYEPGFRILYTDTEPRGEKEESDIAANLYEKGVITRNESRARVGNDAIATGDRFVDGTTPEDAELPPAPMQPSITDAEQNPKAEISQNSKGRPRNAKIAIAAQKPSDRFEQLSLLL